MSDTPTAGDQHERPAFIDPQTDSVECWVCGQHIEDMSRVSGIDISQGDDYYPNMRPVCPKHANGGTDGR